MKLFGICLILISFSASAQQGQFMLVFLNTNPTKPPLPKQQVDSIMAGHLANIARLAKEGKILTAGPFSEGGGIFVMSTASKDTAWEWLRTDPGVQANRWNIELLPYAPRKGSVCSVGESYEMTTYNFVRYTADESLTREASSKAWETHEQYLRSFSPSDSVVAEGVLGNHEGALFIYKGEPDEKFVNAEPAVRAGILLAIRRKLHVARGSFCEE